MRKKHGGHGGRRKGSGRSRQTKQEVLLGGLPGRSKKQIAQHLAGDKIIRSPELHNMDFHFNLRFGSIRDKPQPYYGKASSIQFKNYAEAIEWWMSNRDEWMDKYDNSNDGTRSPIFWEMEFGTPYPWKDKEEVYRYLDKHALWRPGEKEKVIARDGKLPENPRETYPDLEPCWIHAHGCPIIWPEELGIELRDGLLYSNYCEWAIVNGRLEYYREN